jgi:hypothetical protein
MYEYVSGAVVEVETQTTVGTYIDLGPGGKSDLGLPEFFIVQIRLPSEGGLQSIRKTFFSSFGSTSKNTNGQRRRSTVIGAGLQRDATPTKEDMREIKRSRSRTFGGARLYKALRSAAKANRRSRAASEDEVPATVVLAFRIAEEFRENMTCPAIALFKRFSASTTPPEVPLKAILMLQNPDAIPRAFRHLDGKPVLITNSAKLLTGQTQGGASFLEVHVAMSKWSTFAQESIRQLQPMAPDLDFLLGFTIEGNVHFSSAASTVEYAEVEP